MPPAPKTHLIIAAASICASGTLMLTGCGTPNDTATDSTCAQATQSLAVETLQRDASAAQRAIGRTLDNARIAIAWAFTGDGSEYATAVTDCQTNYSTSFKTVQTGNALDPITTSAAQACNTPPDPSTTSLLQIDDKLLLSNSSSRKTCNIKIELNDQTLKVHTDIEKPLPSLITQCVALLDKPGPVILTTPDSLTPAGGTKVVLQMDKPQRAHHCQITYTPEPETALLHE